MQIKIAQKLRPFSHRPGSSCLIPLTTWEVQAYPAKLIFRNLAGEGNEERDLPVTGPVNGWTLLQDLERGQVEVFGKGKEGYFRQVIKAQDLPFVKDYNLPKNHERLSLGSHKKQDWDLVQRRSDLSEILPFLLRLSHLVPQSDFLLLNSNLSEIFSAGFQGILSPRLTDENHLGLARLCDPRAKENPIGLIHAAATIIRDLFIHDDGKNLSLLPHLPKEFHAGRLIRFQDEIDIEWSKKQIKKVVICPKRNRNIFLKLTKGIKSYRLRTSPREKGVSLQRDAHLELQTGKIYFFDRFQR